MASPSLRLPVGDWRVVYRPLSPGEATEGGILVVRIISRRDLDRAVGALVT